MHKIDSPQNHISGTEFGAKAPKYLVQAFVFVLKSLSLKPKIQAAL
jgi:hypothetical protein